MSKFQVSPAALRTAAGQFASASRGVGGALRSVAASGTADAAMGPGPAQAAYLGAVRAWQEALDTQGALLSGLSYLLDAAATAYTQTDRGAMPADGDVHG